MGSCAPAAAWLFPAAGQYPSTCGGKGGQQVYPGGGARVSSRAPPAWHIAAAAVATCTAWHGSSADRHDATWCSMARHEVASHGSAWGLWQRHGTAQQPRQLWHGTAAAGRPLGGAASHGARVGGMCDEHGAGREADIWALRRQQPGRARARRRCVYQRTAGLQLVPPQLCGPPRLHPGASAPRMGSWPAPPPTWLLRLAATAPSSASAPWVCDMGRGRAVGAGGVGLSGAAGSGRRCVRRGEARGGVGRGMA